MTALRALVVAIAALSLSLCGVAFATQGGAFSPDDSGCGPIVSDASPTCISGALLLDGSGFAIMPDGVGATSLDLTMSTRAGDAGTDLVVAGGTLAYGNNELDATSIDASLLRGVRFVQFTGFAEGSDEIVAVNLLGRLVGERGGESLYLITGTLTQGDHVGKTTLAASLSSLTLEPSITEALDTDPTVSILAGSRDATGRDGYLDVSLVEVRPHESITITNKDVTEHRLVSGKVQHWLYERDGPPSVCGQDGELETPPTSETRTDSFLKGGVRIPVVVPEAKESHRCDFVKDGRIDIMLEPGASHSMSISEPGIYNLLDVSKPWIQLEVVSILPDTPLGS